MDYQRSNEISNDKERNIKTNSDQNEIKFYDNSEMKIIPKSKNTISPERVDDMDIELDKLSSIKNV